MVVRRAMAQLVSVTVDGNPADWLQVWTVREEAGARGNVAILRHRLGRTPPAENQQVVNTTLYDLVGAVIEITTDTGIILHRGIVLHPAVMISAEEQAVEYRSVLPEWSFGRPLDGMEVVNQPEGGGGDFCLGEDPVFNPLVDGFRWRNLASDSSERKALDGDGESLEYPVFLDVGSQATPEGQMRNNGGGVEDFPEWKLIDAVRYLAGRTCLYAAEDGSGIVVQQPTADDLEDDLGDYNPVLDNVRIGRGKYLPRCFDDLLEPLGVGWHVSHDEEGTRLRLWPMGEGGGIEPSVLKLQNPDEVVDLDRSNTLAFQAEIDGQNLVNRVTFVTAPVEIEGTWYLWPAWPKTYNLTAYANLLRWEAAADPSLRAGINPKWREDPMFSNVWRLWVLNEGRDYDGIYNGQEDDDAEPLDGAKRLDQLIREVVPELGDDEQAVCCARRRRFMPTLTRGIGRHVNAGDNGGILVEWHDFGFRQGNMVEIGPPSPDTTIGWSSLDTSESLHQCTVLDDQCGLYFGAWDGFADLWAQYAVFKGGGSSPSWTPNGVIRVTATIRADIGYRFTIDAQDDSITPQRVEGFEDRSLAWPLRVQDEGSVFHQDVEDGKLTSAANYTPELLDQYRDQAQELVDQAATGTVRGQAMLEGIHTGYELGQPLESIEGRDIALWTKRPDRNPPRIVAIEWDIPRQKTRIVFESFRRIVQSRGRGRRRQFTGAHHS